MDANEIRNDVLKHWGELMQGGDLLEFKKGQTLFYQGHQPYGVYLIVSGEISLIEKDKAGQKNIQKALIGIPIGIDLICYHQAYPFSGVANTEGCAFFIPKSVVS